VTIRLPVAAMLATAVLAAAPAAVAAGPTLARGEPVVMAQGRLGEPPIDDGGGYAGCWYFPASHGEGHWYGSWNHTFRPVWCGDGRLITYVDPSYHYQSASGLYGSEGVSRFRTGGCVGCGTIDYHALANFSFNNGGWTSHMTRDIWISLLPSNGLVIWSHD
jgi:hypothetical protein